MWNHLGITNCLVWLQQENTFPGDSAALNFHNQRPQMFFEFVLELRFYHLHSQQEVLKESWEGCNL